VKKIGDGLFQILTLGYLWHTTKSSWGVLGVFFLICLVLNLAQALAAEKNK
jgi:hypothetical protein